MCVVGKARLVGGKAHVVGVQGVGDDEVGAPVLVVLWRRRSEVHHNSELKTSRVESAHARERGVGVGGRRGRGAGRVRGSPDGGGGGRMAGEGGWVVGGGMLMGRVGGWGV